MPSPRHTRRQALTLGAAALALTGVRARPATAAPAAGSFELLVPGGGPPAGWRTTEVLTAPARFDLAGLRWARGDRVEAQLRARPRGGPWTR
ncbi:MAG TPA: hypothetical protein VN213_08270, partial [Solirubrobacteraceae bacterium]|nr:hypothetical protein [Solirubrobacteraceae bacterium]